MGKKGAMPLLPAMKLHSLAVFVIALIACMVPDARAQAASHEPAAPSAGKTPAGLNTSDWQSIRAAYEAGRHAFMPVEGQDGHWQARNPGQQWTTRFDGRGFIATPREGGWTWGLELRSYGVGDKQTPVGASPPQVKAEDQRLTYDWDATVQEWWVNDQRGLEHGYVIATRPSALPPSSLSLVLATRGNLSPKIAADALGVLFQDSAGATVLNYTGLKVWDADGKTLPSRFEAAGEGQVRLVVEDADARYPVTIDPIAQQAYMKRSDPRDTAGPGDGFGESVAVSGNTVVVGARFEDSGSTGVNSTPDEAANNAGAAYVFVRNGATWTQQAYLKAHQVTAGDFFGGSVAVSGDTVVVGGYLEDSNTTGVNSTPNEGLGNTGAAYVFVRSGSTWTQQAYLKAHQVSVGDNFGVSVAVSGDTLVVGANFEDSGTSGVNSTPDESATSAGAAYVFVRSGATWTQQAYLKAHQVSEFDQFGFSVAVSGDTAAISGVAERSGSTGVNSTPDESAVNAGAAYVFVRSGVTWTQEAYLKPHQVNANDNFGNSVAVDGDTVVVGSRFEDSSTTGIDSTPNESAISAGAAYVFARSGTTWTQQAYLKAHQVTAGDNFGTSVAVSGDTVVVGAYFEDSSTTGINSTPNETATSAGAAYVFVRSGTAWSQQAYLKAGNAGQEDRFGASVAVSGDTVVVGANLEDSSLTGINRTPNEAAPDSGAAYVFVRGGADWSQQAYVKPTPIPPSGAGPAAFDQFGASVAVSGDTVVIGAPLEDSSTTGVNSIPNESAEDAGAAYVFVRDGGGAWSQQAYLKAHQVTAEDYFGGSVSVSGDTVVVGARNEDSSTSGINSTPNESAGNAGAAYVFVRDGGGVWSQQAYLKAHQMTADDQFGISVAVSGDTVVIGAPWEDSSTPGVNSTPNESMEASGAAYVFVRSGTDWTQQAYLKASHPGSEDEFGTSVSVSGDTAVIGAYSEDSFISGINSTPKKGSSGSASGAAYVFVRNGTTWSQQAYLKAHQVTDGDAFGLYVAVDGDTVVVGAPYEDSGTTGVNSTPDESVADAGAAYVFVRSGTIWSQQAYLKAQQVTTDDRFGAVVAVSGDTIVVGALFEDSATTGINSTPDEGAANAGAAYVFVRNGTVWSQQAYLKASQVTAGDWFGCSVAVSGETVVVGAANEDSASTGVNSTPDENAGNTGAAYLFTGLGPPPEIALSGNGVDIASGDTTPAVADHTDLGGDLAGGSPVTRTFTITNTGSFDLILTGVPFVTLSGSSAFSVTQQPASAIVPAHGGTRTFAVTFNPATLGTRTATVSIASTDADENPFAFDVRATAFSTTADTDSDGLNDWAEFSWSALGFDWEVSQPALVSALFSKLGNAPAHVNAAGFFSTAQVQALNVGVPLIQRDPQTGTFTLTIGVAKSATLLPGSFDPFPMTAPQTIINGAGNLEFQFTVPDDAAFFQIRAE